METKATTVKEVIDTFAGLSEDTKLCPFCYWELEREEDEDMWECVNEHCEYFCFTFED